MIFGVVSEVSEDIATKSTGNRRFRTPAISA